MSKEKEVVIKARSHYSRKVIFTELVAEILSWGESVGLEPQAMTHLMDGFKQKVSTTTQTWTKGGE